MLTFSMPASLDADAQAAWQGVAEILTTLDQKLGLQNTSKPNLKVFESFSSKENVKHWQAWMVKQQDWSFKLCLVQYESTLVHHRAYASWMHRGEDFYFFGHLSLKNDFGRALIRPETWHDSIRELLERQELDFSDYPQFCKRYYVLASDEARFRAVLPPAFFDLMSKVSGLQLEFQGRQCLFRLPKSVEPVESNRLVSLGLALDRVLNAHEQHGPLQR